MTRADTPLLDAPMVDATEREIVLSEDVTVFTGMHVDGYDAASHDGAGGWINDRDISR